MGHGFGTFFFYVFFFSRALGCDFPKFIFFCVENFRQSFRVARLVPGSAMVALRLLPEMEKGVKHTAKLASNFLESKLSQADSRESQLDRSYRSCQFYTVCLL